MGGSGFDAPPAAVSLVPGTVFHARLRPRVHRFSYRVAPILIDLDRLPEAHRASGLFSVNRPNVLSFHERDHGPCDGTPLRRHAEALLASCGFAERPARLLLLAYPRWLGFVFNPLSVYYAFDAGGRLTAALYEVRNTFGEMHTYVAPVADGAPTPSGLRQSARKAFYVSPFVGMAGTYRFRLGLDYARARIRILACDQDGPILAAGFTGRPRDLTSSTVLAALAAMPLMTAKVVVAIHWEALRLWLKGLRPMPRPRTPDGRTRPAPTGR